MKRLVLGTRGSALAQRQAHIIRDALLAAHEGLSVDLREITTHGDRSDAPLSVIGGQGVFTKAIEDALLAGDVDVAVHSMKDLPAQETPDLVVAAVPPREDARDALVSRGGAKLQQLPSEARVGTGSGRRAALIRRLRPDLRTDEIRGNVDTRIRKARDGEYDAVVLALAGLRRLGRESDAAEVFTLDEFVPAVGQGALAVQTRAEDAETRTLVAALDHDGARAAVEAERAYLRRLGAGCRMPVGAHATVTGDTLRIRAMLGGEGDAPAEIDEIAGRRADALALGEALADRLAARVVAR